MTFFALMAALGFVALCHLAWECRQAMPEPAVGVGPTPAPQDGAGLLIVWRAGHIEDMRFMTGPVPELRLPADVTDTDSLTL